jgi:hypothetical protein
MKLGVCMVPHERHGWLEPWPTVASWQALKAIGISELRLQFNTELACPAPGQWKPAVFEGYLRPALDAGMAVYANYAATPAHARHGDPPHMDPAFHEATAFRFMSEYGDVFASVSAGNEPGFDPWMQKDIVNGDGSVDFIRDIYFPEFIVPFAKGVRRARPNAVIDAFDSDSADVHERCMTVANELLESEGLNVCDRETYHPYGDVGGGDYATMARFKEVLGTGPSPRPHYASELDDQQFPGGADNDATRAANRPLLLIPDIEMIARDYPSCLGLMLGTVDYFFEFTQPPALVHSTFYTSNPVLSSPMGERFRDLFAAINKPKVSQVLVPFPRRRRASRA